MRRFYWLAVAALVFGAMATEARAEDELLPSKPDGSVIPTTTMDEQIKPCLEKAPGVRALVNVEGLVDGDGNIRIQVYGDDPEEFLEKGKKLLRIDVPTQKKNMRVCVTFPGPGSYAMVVMHDRNANGRAETLTEGFGFSRNPTLLFTRPDHEEVVFEIAEGVTDMNVELTYPFRLQRSERKIRGRR